MKWIFPIFILLTACASTKEAATTDAEKKQETDQQTNQQKMIKAPAKKTYPNAPER